MRVIGGFSDVQDDVTLHICSMVFSIAGSTLFVCLYHKCVCINQFLETVLRSVFIFWNRIEHKHSYMSDFLRLHVTSIYSYPCIFLLRVLSILHLAFNIILYYKKGYTQCPSWILLQNPFAISI